MSPEVLVAVLSLTGTLVGSVAGILAANKLTVYRIEQLEKKVDKHNSLIERMYAVEERETVTEAEIKRINARIGNLEGN